MSNTEAIWRILAGRASKNCIKRPNTVPPKRPVWTGTKTENAPKGPKNKITPGSRKVIARIEDESNDRRNAEKKKRVVLLSAHLRPGPHNRLTGTIQRICRNVIVRQKTNSSTLYTFAPATLTSPKLMKTQKCKQSELV